MRSLILALACFTSTAAWGQTAVFSEEDKATARALADIALESDLAYELVESLTTEVGARLAGSPEEARARDWSLAKLEALGFEDARIEPFDIPYWTRGAEQARIVAPFPQALEITALGGSVGTPEGGVEGEIVRFATLAELRAATPDQVRGKIVFVDQPTVATMDGAGYGASVPMRSQAPILTAEKGGVAALIRSVGTHSRRFPHTGQAISHADWDKPYVPVAALSPPDADQITRALERAGGEKVVVAMQLGAERFEPRPSGNVIAEIKGSVWPDEIVAVGGHLDSWDLGTGALDDGAGIAITTAAAKLVMDHAPQPKRTIRIIHFGSEEVALGGAIAYAKAYAADLDNHVVVAESDFGARKIWRMTPRFGGENWADARDAFLEVIAPLGVTPGPNTGSGGPDFSIISRQGVPAISWTQNGIDYFNYHHTADDTLDKIDPEELAQNVAVYAAFIWLAANGDVELRGLDAEGAPAEGSQ